MLLFIFILVTPLSIILLCSSVLIYSHDYLSNLCDIVYYILISLYSLNKVSLSAWLSFLFINMGCTAIFITIKSFICISMLVGNLIDVYIYGLLSVLIHILLYYWFVGLVLHSLVLYLFLSRWEFFLVILFYLESFSSLFQSLTLANRLSINLLAGSLVIVLLTLSINVFMSYYLLCSVILLFLCIVFSFEVVNSLIQLFIFSLLTLEYSLIYNFIERSEWIFINIFIFILYYVLYRVQRVFIYVFH